MDSQVFRNRKLGSTCVRTRNPVPGCSEVWVWMHFSMCSAPMWVCDHPEWGQPQGGGVLGSQRKELTTELSASGGSVRRRGTSTPRIHDKGATGDQSKGCCNARVTLKGRQDWMDRRGGKEDTGQCVGTALSKRWLCRVLLKSRQIRAG